MTAVAFNPALPVSTGDKPELAAPPNTNTGTTRDAGTPIGGSLVAQLPRTAAAMPFNKQELSARWEASREHGFNAADATRWALLERMEANLEQAHPHSRNVLRTYTENLQDQLGRNSSSVSYLRDKSAELKSDFWSNVPGSSQWSLLRQVSSELNEAVGALESARAETDRFLNRADSFTYYQNPSAAR